ncbi:hypothetical protein RclHR1_27210003 [Rhizophagus clarus]|uniref:RING-type domain-containing protein n=1 Tax=Rhizophagus clarus TaxID=94130 RepID=A0A2Z6RFK4_9GLOM|nr:hypothetical protein RclHR1_27210003 [Rhizophagus clarus]
MDKSYIEALAINIVSKANALPSSSENINIPKVDLCPICGEDIYTLEGGLIKEFTLAFCGDIFHQKCLEEYLVDGESSCPYDGYNRDIETFLSQDLLKGLQNQTASKDVDNNDEALTEESTNQKKRTRESSTEKSSNKKAKKTGGKKVSSMLKKLIEELLTDVVDPRPENLEEEASENETSNFLQLYDKIDSTESKNEDASQGLIYSYFDLGEAVFKRYKELKLEHGKDGSQALVKSEVRKAIPKAKCSDEALRKRMERSEKVYKLFNSIGKEKITQIKTTPPGFILNLTKDEKDYVMAKILKQKLR